MILWVKVFCFSISIKYIILGNIRIKVLGNTSVMFSRPRSIIVMPPKHYCGCYYKDILLPCGWGGNYDPGKLPPTLMDALVLVEDFSMSYFLIYLHLHNHHYLYYSFSCQSRYFKYIPLSYYLLVGIVKWYKGNSCVDVPHAPNTKIC